MRLIVRLQRLKLLKSRRQNDFKSRTCVRTSSEELLNVTDMIVPNETETEILTGIKITDEASMRKAAKHFIN